MAHRQPRTMTRQPRQTRPQWTDRRRPPVVVDVPGTRGGQQRRGCQEDNGSPGKEYRTAAGGTELIPDLRPACAAPKPLRRNGSREKAARIARRRRRIEERRPVNEAIKRLAKARQREIQRRMFRNEMRVGLMLFKGGEPSTSPFCPRVNDPMEHEQLTPDWQPPPGPPPPPEDLPF
jgi:hypothetical protein